uniref:Uncharacterized protein n=1 Tax=Arundo donax TaxID=35708 RepID=A0A0A9FER8_ARUDO
MPHDQEGKAQLSINTQKMQDIVASHQCLLNDPPPIRN